MRARGQHHRFTVAVWAGTLLLAVSLWLVALMLVRRDESDTMARAERDTGNLARVVAEQTSRAVAEADQVLLFLIDELQTHVPRANHDIRDLIRNAVLRSSILVQIAVIDERGDLVMTSVEDAPTRVHLGDREHFRVHVADPAAGLFIGKPVFGRASGKWSIQLTRRIDKPDGGFAGVIVASMDPFYFSRSLENLDVGPDGVVAIIGKDGVLRARSILNEQIIGQDVSQSQTVREAMVKPKGFLRVSSVIDRIPRLQSYRVLNDYPLIVTAAFGEGAFLADTRLRQRVYIIGAAVSSVGLMGLALLATRQSARLAASAQRLTDSEQRFRDQAETASDWFWEMDADLRFSRLIGPLVPQTADGALPIGLKREDVALREPGDAAKWVEHQGAMDRRESFRNFRYRVKTPGGVRYFSVSGRPIWSEDGVFLGYRGSATDITERELSALRLQSSEARYRAMFSSVGQPIVTIDEAGVVDAVNPAAERLFGYAAREVVGGSLARLLPSAFSVASDGRLEFYRSVGAMMPLSDVRDFVGRRKDGSEFPIEVTLAGWRNGDRSYYTAALRDITAQREIEASLRRAKEAADHANRMKSEFLATMSHEIRTPMNGVLGALALVDGPNLDTDQRQMLDIANRSGHALLQIIDDILDLSKLEAGKVEVEPLDFDTRVTLGEIVQLLHPTASGRSLSLEATVDPAVPVRARADVRRIRQVLVNLIGNALKFTDQGGVSVRVSLEEPVRADGGFVLRFEVQDTGIGIPAEVLPNLFRRFTQADSSTTRRFGGTGLGLAISRELVTVMGGRIGVRSGEGAGSTFWFIVPCQAAAPVTEVPTGQREPSVPSAPPSVITPRRLRVLVVEDNDINRDIVLTMLERAGHQAVAVGDGAQAVRAVQEQPFDLVLMDVQMPVMDGITATRCIRALPGAVARIPIVALTGNAMPDQQAEYRDAGMTAYLAKPIATADLFTLLATLSAGGASEPLGAVTAPVGGAAVGLMPPNDEVIDRRHTESLRGAVGAAAWGQATASFAETAHKIVAQLRAVADADPVAVSALAHNLKGTAANIGALRLSRAAARLEKCDFPDDWPPLLDDLDAALTDTLAALSADAMA
ncbi:PAS domain S-box protein [Azospirillum griseum]|uniref:Sensory/regulatory protein RpfC n=1 Tax=Azospirillum griseum TaxID=2496639 RepID=A0A431VEB1_9PROT|nr:PAS domain S-box protein [Azospirillum griseum]RTR18097.1 PAS domain S-box protein [Azospirillum griseum]